MFRPYRGSGAAPAWLTATHLDVWAGVLPVHAQADPPIRDPRLKTGVRAPRYLKAFRSG